MKTNFFELLNSVQTDADWTICIKSTAGAMLVSVLLKNERVSDQAKNVIPPVLLKGSVGEMDEGFFSSLAVPVRRTAGLLLNIEDYEKSQEEAKRQSRAEQERLHQEKRDKETATKKWETQMKKVTDLEAAGKFREAFTQLPKAADFPDHEKELEEKKQELQKRFEQPGLF